MTEPQSWRKCPNCGNDLVYSHRVTLNSWVYLCQKCETHNHITEYETVKEVKVVERIIDVYGKNGIKLAEIRQKVD